MSDLIKREDAIKAMEQRYQDILRIFNRKVKVGEKAIALDMIGCIKTLPSADTDLSEYSDKLWKNAYERGKADRPQGEWIPSDTDGFVCSVCKNGYRNQPTLMGRPMFEYCPVCGAKMKGADDE